MYTQFLNLIKLTIWTICISGTTPSSVILSQTRLFKNLGSDIKECQNRLNLKKRWCNKPSKLHFHSISNTDFFLMLSNATNQPKSTVELDFMCPCGFFGPSAVILIKYLKYKKSCIRHFKLDSNNDIGQMRISGSDPWPNKEHAV